MANSPKTMSSLMCELSVALADLAEKMSNLAINLENQYLDSDAEEPAALMEAARSTIEKARSN
ncbi:MULTISPECIES: hypothetical protein [Herbaspirillum]|jgi:hypothetical protein|uniref:hypothetical protein n=1 Tax=Herbaspirillum TaxID=963 RepID=UPI000493FF17|nr:MULTISPECIES: hypothetical protein [Herbaspirillum]MCW5300074.1 hypothetical protein [Herbaspirillum lusitanum]RFB69882.1 hypothetical protein DZB54_14685 [Herbaspirillum sp. 3R-3a1]TFI07054.1 hypothetical protein E4P32_14115 [Herbaspirillum sp. 3R11]TFI12992.1 hypothetical protein E4P31_19240 [Herbaspirillum sp. 3R-11]TFI27043.1 hypothetical protein E4P30_10810 [Herbaspirillum sp. 3C11]